MDPSQPRTLKKMLASGEAADLAVSSLEAMAFATAAATEFKVGPSRTVAFDSALANRIRRLWATEKVRDKLKELAKTHPLTMAELDVFEKREKEKAPERGRKKGITEPQATEE